MLGDNITLSIIVGAALADSINPCVLGVLIFLLIFLNRAFKNRKQMLICGLLYSFVVYVTYLALGFGILKVAASAGFATAFYWVAAVIAIVAGILEIKDYFWYGRGFSLQMIPGASKRLKLYTQKIENLYERRPRLSMILVALLGVFVVLVELPCTGAPYFAVLALLAQGAYTTAIPYLLLYNFVFVLPLLVIILIAFFGRGEAIEEWRMRHRGLMRLGIGLFLIALGAYMIYSISPFVHFHSIF
jgi:cytochrome c biogenesis protein CcdA